MCRARPPREPDCKPNSPPILVLSFAAVGSGRAAPRRRPGGHRGLPQTPLRLLCLTALGVVYGDIGTSPLYALRECFYGEYRVAVSPENVLGVLSLIFWALVVVVAAKYHVYVLRMDNNGEGGILALMALVRPHSAARPDGERSRRTRVIVVMGLFGAALLYGDGMITPAISVLSAVEGLDVATEVFHPLVVPITIVILVLLFLFQRRGTAGVGAVFGPVMTVWRGSASAGSSSSPLCWRRSTRSTPSGSSRPGA
jgi:KUP system potassium uptake protein